MARKVYTRGFPEGYGYILQKKNKLIYWIPGKITSDGNFIPRRIYATGELVELLSRKAALQTVLYAAQKKAKA